MNAHPNSPLNGNIVSVRFHAMTDNFAWRRLPRREKAILRDTFGRYAPLSKTLQQFLRAPLWLYGGGVMSVSKATASEECGCYMVGDYETFSFNSEGIKFI